jgi:hypothetical protein
VEIVEHKKCSTVKATSIARPFHGVSSHAIKRSCALEDRRNKFEMGVMRRLGGHLWSVTTNCGMVPVPSFPCGGFIACAGQRQIACGARSLCGRRQRTAALTDVNGPAGSFRPGARYCTYQTQGTPYRNLPTKPNAAICGRRWISAIELQRSCTAI